ncbi:hypothetical protein EV356DRAFT_106909 [Viridothelium virens]|uniref:Uncharacterized protein n=1 Tax=Viridothelium virens TaxID=1048519 RepID=A0A6A6HNG0_VIRVR|nr:hypothetical protein EV356DRAFT_106909 [Viridothelium virens]
MGNASACVASVRSGRRVCCSPSLICCAYPPPVIEVCCLAVVPPAWVPPKKIPNGWRCGGDDGSLVATRRRGGQFQNSCPWPVYWSCWDVKSGSIAAGGGRLCDRLQLLAHACSQRRLAIVTTHGDRYLANRWALEIPWRWLAFSVRDVGMARFCTDVHPRVVHADLQARRCTTVA